MSYYNCKVTFTSGEVTKSGKPIVTRSEILVEAVSITDAEATISNHLGDTITDYELTSVTKSKIESVLSATR